MLYQGWGDGSAGKALATEAREPDSESQNRFKARPSRVSP